MSLVIDLNSVCLVCFQDSGGELHEVFSSDEETPQFTIAEKITLCSDLQLETVNNKLPDKICTRCINDLAAAWRFRQNCETAKTVFRSIQQQEEDAEALATFELECQKIKVPSGLKIKRIQPETKTFLLPVELKDKEQIVDASQDEQLALEPITSHIIVEGEELRTEEAEDAEEEVITEENVDLEDYYEAEEILDDVDMVVGQLEHVDDVKIERRDEMVEVKPQQMQLKVKNEKLEDEMKEDNYIKKECDDLDSELEQRLKIQKHLAKRPRGRPRKITPNSTNLSEVNRLGTTSPSSIKSVHIKTEKENLNEVTAQSENHSESDATSSPRKSKLNVKSFASNYANYQPVKTRKRRKSRNHPPKICEICGNTYKYQHALTAHMRRHTNDRPFSCEFCDKAFVSGVELRRHMRVHTGQKPYPCQFCERRFSDFGSRIKHERTHTGERPYRCKTCDKAFAYAHVLSVHLRTHTGEKKFQCSRCGKGFTKKAYLLSHMEQHARAASAENYLGQQQQQDTINDGEHIALEECIFTTEYIEEDEDVENYEGTEVEFEEVAEEDIEDEEHLDETEPELILGVR